MIPSLSELLSSNNFSHHNFSTLAFFIIITLIFIALLSVAIVSIIFSVIYILLNYIQPLFLYGNFSNDRGPIFDRSRFTYNRDLGSHEQILNEFSTKSARIQFINWLLPSTRYGAEEMNLKYDDCAICLEDYIEGDLCRIFPVCNHMFHSNCLDAWLEKNLTCPMCRQSIFIM